MTLGIVGCGRFGRAFGELAGEAGWGVRAWDPHAPVPDAWRCRSLGELAAACETIVVATPVYALAGALAALRPHVGPAHLVLDVCSVKVTPIASLRAILGDAVPWIGTHPLFGPASLALGERPLRVVVCPRPERPEATARARAVFGELGCVVIDATAEDHDRHMAETHALAFFVAKAMIDAGFAVDPRLAPPSFRAMARTIRAVREDAGHLFSLLHLDNPFAPAARSRLMEALATIDRTLQQSREDPGAEAEALMAIADLGERSPVLRQARELIDEIDRELLGLLARRAELARRAGQAKAELGEGVWDPAREAKLLAARRRWAAELELPETAVESIFTAILELSRGVQARRT